MSTVERLVLPREDACSGRYKTLPGVIIATDDELANYLSSETRSNHLRVRTGAHGANDGRPSAFLAPNISNGRCEPKLRVFEGIVLFTPLAILPNVSGTSVQKQSSCSSDHGYAVPSTALKR